MPLPTDFVALLGIDLVLCAVCLWVLSCWPGGGRWRQWIAAAVFVLLWWPAGSAQLPLLAYVRGITSDPSVTLVAMACLALYRRGSGRDVVRPRERTVLAVTVAALALVLYPTALGWGDWDAYRLGWGSPVLWLGLLLGSVVCWFRGLRLLPLLVALALLAWTAGALESTNLWDYLMDPWLAVAAIFRSLKTGSYTLWVRFGRAKSNAASLAAGDAQQA
ncbi:MAG: hypothetical protein ABIP46_06160 [Polaromonas sp.]